MPGGKGYGWAITPSPGVTREVGRWNRVDTAKQRGVNRSQETMAASATSVTDTPKPARMDPMWRLIASGNASHKLSSPMGRPTPVQRESYNIEGSHDETMSLSSGSVIFMVEGREFKVRLRPENMVLRNSPYPWFGDRFPKHSFNAIARASQECSI